jgi:hypothetical protein
MISKQYHAGKILAVQIQILSKRTGYYLLTTAYTHSVHKEQKFMKEMKVSKDPRRKS